MAKLNFETLNKKLRDLGADWVAGETSHSKFYGSKVGSVHLGLSLTPEMAFPGLAAARNVDEAKRAAAAPAPLPTSLDWRNHSGKNWVTPVRDQGGCGACVAFATCASLESRLAISQNLKNIAAIDLSEAHLFFCGTPHSCKIGWYPTHSFNFAENNGVGTEASFPYTPGNQACQQVPSVVKAVNPGSAGVSHARRVALQKGPVVGCMAVYQDFYTYKSGVYRHVFGELAGYHAVCVVGYDDDRACWIVKNSWGTDWGSAGFFEIRYGECGLDTQYPFYFSDVQTVGSKIYK